MNRLFNVKYFMLFLTVMSVALPVWIWKADLSSHSLQVRVASQVSLQPENVNSINGLQISIDGGVLKSPYLTVLELSNNGDKPIPASDFEAPLEIRISDRAVIARAQITESNPVDIEAVLTWEAQSVKIKPLLLNSKDVLTISILTSGEKPEISTRARISGISHVPIDDKAGQSSKLQKSIFFLFSALFLFIASDLTNGSMFNVEPIMLRRRSAILVSTATGLMGAMLYVEFLDVIGVTNIFLVALAFVPMMLASILFSLYWNRTIKPINIPEV